MRRVKWRRFIVLSNKIDSVSLRKCPYDHWLTNKPYLSAITETNIYKIFLLSYKMAAIISWRRYRTKLRHGHPVYNLDPQPTFIARLKFTNFAWMWTSNRREKFCLKKFSFVGEILPGEGKSFDAHCRTVLDARAMVVTRKLHYEFIFFKLQSPFC